MRPDGTKEELFYKSSKGNELVSRGIESNNGKIFLIESDSNTYRGWKSDLYQL